MKKLFVSSIKMLYRDKQALFWAMMFPVIFATVFGLFDLDRGPTIHVAVVAPTQSTVEHSLVSGLVAVTNFKVTESRDLASARAKLTAGKEELVVALPAKTGAVRVFYDQKNANRNAGALAVVRAVVDKANLRIAGVSHAPLPLVTEPVRARTFKYYDFLLPGLVGMGVMTFAITGMGIAITRFREQQILKRILATPLRPVRFLAAQVGARLVLSVVQAAVILAVGMLLFHGHVYGNMLWIFVLVVFANLAFLNIGFAIAGRAPNPDAAQGMGQAVAIPMMFLSGVFFPLDTLPSVIHSIVRFLPLTPLLDALRKVAIDGASITGLGSQLGQLAIWVVITFLIASRSFRFAQE